MKAFVPCKGSKRFFTEESFRSHITVNCDIN